uniref:DUF6598 domain-containing protein n=1 Tax=Oryza barthii TaxID=65489 RepID=A0A0D3G9J3_9ORYZ
MAMAAEEACHGGGGGDAGFDLAEHLQQQPLLTSDDRPKAPTMIDDDDDEINAKYDECNAEVEEYNEECMRKTEELNSALPEEEHYYCVHFLPRSLPEPLFYTVHRMYFMHDTNPSNKLYTNLEDRDYPITMIQIFSIRFAGDGVQLDQSMRVYGFVAIRDELDCRRNYVFNRSRDDPCEITPVCPTLPLISPARGTSIIDGVLLEYSLKAKRGGGGDGDGNDVELIDGCIEFTSPSTMPVDEKLKTRIYGRAAPPPGGGAAVAVDMAYAFIERGVEATVEVEVRGAPPPSPGHGRRRLNAAALTSGYEDEIVLFDGPLSSSPSSSSSSSLSSPAKLAFSAVVAVAQDDELSLRLEAVTGGEGGLSMAVSRSYLSFEAHKHGSSVAELVMAKDLELVRGYFKGKEDVTTGGAHEAESNILAVVLMEETATSTRRPEGGQDGGRSLLGKRDVGVDGTPEYLLDNEGYGGEEEAGPKHSDL